MSTMSLSLIGCLGESNLFPSKRTRLSLTSRSKLPPLLADRQCSTIAWAAARSNEAIEEIKIVSRMVDVAVRKDRRIPHAIAKINRPDKTKQIGLQLLMIAM